jgi:N utilization substance protein A
MATDVSEAVRLFMQDRGFSEEMALKSIEEALLAAYKKHFGIKSKDDRRDRGQEGSEEAENPVNAVVRFSDDNNEVTLYARKTIVDGVYDPVTEIELDEARKLNPEGEIGDELLIEIDPKSFDRGSVQSAKQTFHQSVRETQRDYLYSEYKDKQGEIIIGYYQRERDGTIYVDLGKVEGLLPKRYQSAREVYHSGDRIKALIKEVNKGKSGLEIILSRTDTDFVAAIFELEVPEVYDKTVVIHKIVREAGYRTKMAVYSNRDDVDPVGACVGLKGVRIQAIIRELEGEKIDVLKYDPDPRTFIKNALSPAEVRDVIIKDEAKHEALAVVSESQLSLAIGKQGLNVRLANRLVDWNIDVKTEEQFAGMDMAAESRRGFSRLFGESDEYEDEISRISELPGVDEGVAELLRANGIEYIEDFLSMPEADKIEGITSEQVAALRQLIDENFEIVEEEEYEAPETPEEEEPEESKGEEPEEYECPECGAKITTEMTHCPNCGVEISFEYEDEGED